MRQPQKPETDIAQRNMKVVSGEKNLIVKFLLRQDQLGVWPERACVCGETARIMIRMAMGETNQLRRHKSGTHLHLRPYLRRERRVAWNFFCVQCIYPDFVTMPFQRNPGICAQCNGTSQHFQTLMTPRKILRGEKYSKTARLTERTGRLLCGGLASAGPFHDG